MPHATVHLYGKHIKEDNFGKTFLDSGTRGIFN